ncbi:hypothetical protein [Pseudophaeobacter sp.]|uniref:hypothetical protein n=1 Tax=Pseudophaeobacter sp. TaxID=1971739 RepID=UPI003298D87B
MWSLNLALISKFWKRGSGLAFRSAIYLFAFTALSVRPAMALSCERSATDVFLQLEAARDAYYIVEGRLDFDPELLPTSGGSGLNPEPVRVPAHLSGHLLTNGEPGAPIALDVLLEIHCHEERCGPPGESGKNYISFVELRETGSIIYSSPCFGHLFPSRFELEREWIYACQRGDDCVPGWQQY